jgi:hypothetical protein
MFITYPSPKKEVIRFLWYVIGIQTIILHKLQANIWILELHRTLQGQITK